MRSIVKFTSTAVFAFSLSMLVIAGISSVAQAAAVSPCLSYVASDGSLRCPADRCGLFWLKICQIVIWLDPVTLLPTGLQTCECR